MALGQKAPTPEMPEVYSSVEALRAVHGEDAPFEYSASAGGYIPKYYQPKIPEAPETPEEKQLGLHKYQDAVLSSLKNRGDREGFDNFAKTQGIKADYDTWGMTAGQVAGIGEPEKPRATALGQLNEYKQKMLKTDTWEEALDWKNEYTEAGYDASQLKITKEDWVNSKLKYLNNLLNCIKATINEKGWLKGTDEMITPQQVGGQIDKSAPAPEVYELFREEYMKYRDILEKAGIDVSNFPRLKPLSEIEKVGFLEGLKTIGLGRGQYKSIYY